MAITYKHNTTITAEAFSNLLHASGLAERRPVDDKECIEGMINNTNLCLSAWHNDQLIGIARSVTDFHYCCYVSDLAVDSRYQNQGIGKELLALTQQKLGKRCKVLLLASPDANNYYPHIGFEHNDRCWVLNPI